MLHLSQDQAPVRTFARRPDVWGVFVWSADPSHYVRANVYSSGRPGVCTFATERGAQAKAIRLSTDQAHYAATAGRGFVARRMTS